MGDTLKKFFSILGGLMAFLTIVAFAFILINAQFNLVHNEVVLQVLAYVQTYALIATVGITALEFASDKGIAVFVVTALLIAVVVIFTFLPGTKDVIIGWVGNVVKK